MTSISTSFDIGKTSTRSVAANRSRSPWNAGGGADGVRAVAVRDADHLGNPGEAVGDLKGAAADRDQY